MESRNLIDAIISGDKAAAKAEFSDIMQGKMFDAVDTLKTSVAQQMFNKANIADENV